MTIRNIRIIAQNLHVSYSPSTLVKLAPLTIKNCSFATLYYLYIHIDKQTQKKLKTYKLALVAINILGNSNFSHVTCYDGIQILYNETHADGLHHNLLNINSCTLKTMIQLEMLQNSYRVILKIINMKMDYSNIYDTDFIKSFIHIRELGSNAIHIITVNLFQMVIFLYCHLLVQVMGVCSLLIVN